MVAWQTRSGGNDGRPRHCPQAKRRPRSSHRELCPAAHDQRSCCPEAGGHLIRFLREGGAKSAGEKHGLVSRSARSTRAREEAHALIRKQLQWRRAKIGLGWWAERKPERKGETEDQRSARERETVHRFKPPSLPPPYRARPLLAAACSGSSESYGNAKDHARSVEERWSRGGNASILFLFLPHRSFASLALVHTLSSRRSGSFSDRLDTVVESTHRV